MVSSVALICSTSTLLASWRGVDVGVIAVAGIGQLLHQPIVVVAGAETERGERDAALALSFNQILQCLEIDRADVEIAIGGQNHSVDAALDEALPGQVVGQLNTRATVGGTTALS